MLRLDKFLAQSGERSRSEATRLIRAGAVHINGVTVRDPATKLDPAQSEVTLQGVELTDQSLQYYLLHKPAGVLTAARDSRAQTVMSLVPEALFRRNVLPVGRLDKDTTGLLLLTNDGELAHRLLSPRRHVQKEYHATVQGRITQEDVSAFAHGLVLSDFVTLPAELRILHADDEHSRAVVLVCEGKFHQIKRMFASRGHEVTALHREAFGPLRLPADLPPGAARPLSGEELRMLKSAAYTQDNETEGNENA